MARLIRRLLHLHWYSETVFPPTSGPERAYPFTRCRCGATKFLGDASRWYVGYDDEWEYDDADYGPW